MNTPSLVRLRLRLRLRLRRGRRWLAGLLLCSAAACTSDQPPSPEDATAGRVLVISPPGVPSVERLVGVLAAGGQGSPPLPPIATDVSLAMDAAQATAAVRQAQPLQGRYRAIYTNSLTFARAAQIAAPNIPIVFEGVNDPVALCVVDSVQRPGRNATGYMHYLKGDQLKMLELLRDAYPALRDVLFLVSGDNLPPPSCDPNDAYWTTPPATDCAPGEHGVDAYVQRRVPAAELTADAATQGLRMRFVVLCTAQDFPALAQLGASHPGAGWLVPWQTLFDGNRAALARELNASGLPAVYPNHGFTRAGGLMSLAALLDDGADRASLLSLLRVLGGGRPGHPAGAGATRIQPHDQCHHGRPVAHPPQPAGAAPRRPDPAVTR